jgi:hypothetical protein
MNFENKKLLLSAAAGLILSLISFSQGAVYGGGNGTAENPFQIWTAEQMNTIGLNPDDWDDHFLLMADLDLSAYTGTQYNIIGDYPPFTGTLNGNGHVIRNLTIERSTQSSIGLFGTLGTGGQIINLGVENTDLYGYQYVGRLVGANFGTITACYATGKVNGENWVGGLIGQNYGTITACYATGMVDGGYYPTFIGGLVGTNLGTITACYATGWVIGDYYVGGLVGRNANGTITACYATANVYGENIVGGLIGNNNGGTITACYASGMVSCWSSWSIVGGLIGDNSGTITACFWDIQTSGKAGSAGGKGLTTAQMKTMSIYQNAGWADKGWVMNDNVDYPRLSWENTSGVPIPSAQPIPLAGSGTPEDPYLVSTAQEFALLSWYSDVLNKHLRLTANLDVSGITLSPIGDLGPFTGVFDGNGYTVSNAVISQPASCYVGLFCILGTGGQIRNLGIDDMDMVGFGLVGGLVGENRGTITACYAMGTVSSSLVAVGGLVGSNYYGTITACYANCAVIGGSNVGGLAGSNYYGTITACYAMGQVSGTSYIGGLVGYNNYGTITACYSTGAVSGTSYIGGLVGINSGSGTITACFWDIQTSNRPTSAGGTGKTTTEMQTLSTFTSASWDFTNEITNGTNEMWRMCADGVDYPRLNWQSIQGDFACPDGVYLEDLIFILDRWLTDNCSQANNFCGGADLNFSDAVDLTDIAIFAENWLRE